MKASVETRRTRSVHQSGERGTLEENRNKNRAGEIRVSGFLLPPDQQELMHWQLLARQVKY